MAWALRKARAKMQEGIFTATEYREPALEPGMRYEGPIETLIGNFTDERDAIEAARGLWKEFRLSGSHGCGVVDRSQGRRRPGTLDCGEP